MIPPGSEPDPNDPLGAREQEVLAELADADLDTPLSEQVGEQEGVPVLRLSGELEMATAELFRHHAEPVLAAHPHSLVVDLSRLSYIDSHGLGLLMRAARQVPGTLAVVTTQERIVRILQATGLDRTMPVFRTVPDALAHLGKA
jgi:anti-anti-sigma factor